MKKTGTIFAEVLIAITLIGILYGGKIAVSTPEGTTLVERDAKAWADLTSVANAIRAQKFDSGNFPTNLSELAGSYLSTLPTFKQGSLGYITSPQPVIFIGSNPVDMNTVAKDRENTNFLISISDIGGIPNIGTETLVNKTTHYELSASKIPPGIASYFSQLKVGELNLAGAVRKLRHRNFTDGYDLIDLDVECYEYLNNVTVSTNTLLGSATNDTRTVFARYNGNLTINAGNTLTVAARKKGFFIYVNGDLTVNGTISMTARGATAAGQFITLLHNDEEGAFTVGALGGSGGAAVTNGGAAACSGTNTQIPGINGDTAINFACGGGGSGNATMYFGAYASLSCSSGAGGAGTTWSGGGGGGGSTVTYATKTVVSGTAGSSTGGPGGDGSRLTSTASGACGSTYTLGYLSFGGAGNPSGTKNPVYPYAGICLPPEDGTGGLLVIFVRGNLILGATGRIQAQGSRGGDFNNLSYRIYKGFGGSSGGGSVNVFYGKKLTNNGSINALGGGRPGTVNPLLFRTEAGNEYAGGFGGNGTVRTQKVSSFHSNQDLPIPVGVIHSWPLLTNGDDVVGGWNAVTTGTVTFNDTTGAYFANTYGTINYVGCLKVNQVMLATRPASFTYTVWAKRNGAAGNPHSAIFSDGSVYGTCGLLLPFETGVQFVVPMGGGIGKPYGNFATTTAVWADYILCGYGYDADSGKVLLFFGNTVFFGTKDNATYVGSTVGPLTIGGAVTYYPFRGYIKDVRMYDKCLTVEELAALRALGPQPLFQ